jgi:hypothetical protein
VRFDSSTVVSGQSARRNSSFDKTSPRRSMSRTSISSALRVSVTGSAPRASV